MGRLVRGFVARSHHRVEGTRTAISLWVRGVISPVDEMGRAVGGFVVRSRRWTRWVDRWVGGFVVLGLELGR